MKLSSLNLLVALCAGLFAAVVAKPAEAQLPPSSNPLVISRPGVYVLNRSIVVTGGDAVTINASNVTLDLNGHSLSVATPGQGRGVVVNAGRGVTVKNGKVGAFNMNLVAMDVQNLTVEKLQVTGAGLAPSGGPVEIGLLLINCRGANVVKNTITSVNLGVFVRGPRSRGNRFVENQIVGGPDAAHNLLAMCWNPLPGGDATNPADTPQADFVYNNHISQYATGVSFVAGSRGNIVKENNIQFFNAAFSAATSNANNILEGNSTIQVLP